MIFVTVGENGPFDRLVRCVDAWAGEQDKVEAFAQIGRTDYVPRHIEWAERLHQEEFLRLFSRADAIVAHAGMGTILSALELGVPVLVMPRLAALGEQRNDHQLATARALKESGKINVADDEHALREMLDQLDDLRLHPRIPTTAPEPLVKTLREFIKASVRD